MVCSFYADSLCNCLHPRLMAGEEGQTRCIVNHCEKFATIRRTITDTLLLHVVHLACPLELEPEALPAAKLEPDYQ